MKKLSTSICLGLGDNIVARIIFDTVKHNYDQIRISHDKNIIQIYKNGDSNYMKFLKDIGNLLFTEPPYYFDSISYPAIHTFNTTKNLYIPGKPNLEHKLCKGTPLNLGQEYIVITTKIRGMARKTFYPLSIKLWQTLRQLSTKYKIVILGEREVEKNIEYLGNPDLAYSIYDQIIANLPINCIIDLTIPALGNIAPTLSQIQQDGLIMRQAKFTITLGMGGNVWLAAGSGSQVIGFREDGDPATDIILGPNFTSVRMTKDWNQFIKRLGES